MHQKEYSENFFIKRRHHRTVKPTCINIDTTFTIYAGNAQQVPINNSSDDNILIKLLPSIPSAFGSQSLHITTRYILTMLSKYLNAGAILDVGTGNGLLSIAAQLLAQKRDYTVTIDAFDIYSDAIAQSRINMRWNGVNKKINLRLGRLADYQNDHYQLVLANLPPVAIDLLWSELISKLQQQGIIILSGFLHHNATRWIEKFELSGCQLIDKVITDFWCLMVMQRAVVK